jgi:protein gp37
MFREMKRWNMDPTWIRRSKGKTFNGPLKWEPDFVFTCSWSDFFLQEADRWRDEAWEVIRQTPFHIYQVLTKRPENILDRLPEDWGDGWEHVWLGVSVETEQWLHRIDTLAQVPARLRFVSYEPALGEVSFEKYLADRLEPIQWIVSGGESGAHCRKAQLDWFRKVRDECLAYNVPFFHKQHGGRKKFDGSWGGNVLDGQVWQQFPYQPKKGVLL